MLQAAERTGAFTAPGRPWSHRIDTTVAVLVGLGTFLVRWTHASRSLYTVDSVLFSLATESYDLMALRPHPPGYPLFVAAGKLLLPVVGHDHNRAFVLQAALWSGLAVALLYALARRWGSRRAALVAALLFALAPAFAFNGTIALSYTAEAAAMVAVALLAWHAATRPTTTTLLALGAAWALAVGIRQSLFLFLAPVVGLALLGLPLARPDAHTLRRTAVAGAAALGSALAWFLPMAYATGGVAQVREATRLQSSEVVFADAVWVRGWPAFVEHVDRLAFFLHWETAAFLPLAAMLAAVGVGAAVLRRNATAAEPGAWPAGAGVFLATWLLPCLLFYILVFDGWERGPIGYVLSLLPGVYLVAVLLADQGLRRLAAAQNPRLHRAVAAVGLLLLLLPAPGLHSEGNDLIAREATAHDEWAERWQQVAGAYSPDDTAILTWQSWAHVQWYFPEFTAWTYFPTYAVEGKTDWALLFTMRDHRHEAPFIRMYTEGPDRPDHPIPPGLEHVVVFDFQLAGEGGEERRLDPALNVTETFLPDGWRILTFDLDGSHPTVESLFTPEALGQGARAPRQAPEGAATAR